MIAAAAGTALAAATLLTTDFAGALLADVLFATADRRAGLAALRRLTPALGFFTDLRADFADFVVFFLVPAATLEARLADLLVALLMARIIHSPFRLSTNFFNKISKPDQWLARKALRELEFCGIFAKIP
jgi:hypothetical protein